MLINKRKNKDLKHLNDCKPFIEYPNDMDDTYKNIEKYNLNRKRETLIVFDDMITDMLSNKKLFTHYFIRKIPNKQELQQIAINNSSVIDVEDFMNLYKKCTVKPYSFLVNDTICALGNSLRFKSNILERIYKLIITFDDKIRDDER